MICSAWPGELSPRDAMVLMFGTAMNCHFEPVCVGSTPRPDLFLGQARARDHRAASSLPRQRRGHHENQVASTTSAAAAASKEVLQSSTVPTLLLALFFLCFILIVFEEGLKSRNSN